MAAAAIISRPLRPGAAWPWAAKRLLSQAGGGSVRRGWRRPAQVSGKSTFFRRGLALSAVSCLGYEAYNFISHSAVVHASIKVEEILEQADYLYGSGETEKLYQLLIQHKTSEDAEILWRLARASRDLAQLSSTSAEEKKQLIYEALEYAKKALEKNESSFAVHKWYAICLSDIGDYKGIKTKIANSYIIKEHFQKAIELNPKDATSIHLMGIWHQKLWELFMKCIRVPAFGVGRVKPIMPFPLTSLGCYSFAEMPWYQSKIAAMLFETPPSSTYEEALSYFHMAEEADPNFYSKNLLLLAKTYLKLNNKKMALLWLTKARDYPAHTEEDKEVQKEVMELLNSI